MERSRTLLLFVPVQDCAQRPAPPCCKNNCKELKDLTGPAYVYVHLGGASIAYHKLTAKVLRSMQLLLVPRSCVRKNTLQHQQLKHLKVLSPEYSVGLASERRGSFLLSLSRSLSLCRWGCIQSVHLQQIGGKHFERLRLLEHETAPARILCCTQQTAWIVTKLATYCYTKPHSRLNKHADALHGLLNCKHSIGRTGWANSVYNI